jgi:acrylyl-CoA reductase (NADPH)|uniref:YhdH/YhfP family quinone oxidoreductase n=1 Tax=Dyadobacter sp. MSC1_007 TaxID=2909264 RepID=UPI00202FA9B2|nr:YhdH/YhfP family quinone oxidoreductase [Dyadobacter sp. MSC1_007]
MSGCLREKFQERLLFHLIENMASKKFKALEVKEIEPGKFQSTIVAKNIDELPAGEVLIRVHYSSVNYKDALSANGNKAVTRGYPHIPGIDVSGVVEESSSAIWHRHDQVIVTGFDLGMNTSGGFAEYIRVPAAWVLKLPDGLTLREAMIYGTAGLTAGLSVSALIHENVFPEMGTVAVSGATGGVGSLSVALLARLGYRIAAISSKASSKNYLESIGASEVIARADMEDKTGKILLRPRFAAAIDTVGGNVLSTLINSLDYGGVVTACGMVNGGDLNTTVFPFILKGIKLIGIDSVELPLIERMPIWENLGSSWRPEKLNELAQEVALSDLPQVLDQISQGQMQGRAIVSLY